jgi:hypothetical protein
MLFATMRTILTISLLFCSVLAHAQSTSPDLPPNANAKKEKEWKKKKDKMVADENRKNEKAKKALVGIQDKATRKRMKQSKRKAKKFNSQKHKADK